MKYSSADAGRFRVVRVFDGFGNEQVPTYPKRAKGLVKNGRAQWLSGDSIVLIGEISSPNEKCADCNLNDTEDTIMSDKIIDQAEEITADAKIIDQAEEITADANDATLSELISILTKIGSDIKGDIKGAQDEVQVQAYVTLYTETLNVIKDITKQNQEVKLAQLKCAKE